MNALEPIAAQPVRVVADALRFKQKLRIGEEAFALLRAKNRLSSLWDTVGAAGTGAAIASSPAVATSFFAPSGLTAMLGLVTAATPVGWVAAAAVVAGGGYYGVSRWFNGKSGTFTDTIPKYINTPIDVLGAALIDLLGSLAVRIAAIDGKIDLQERDYIAEHFVSDWGFDPAYVSKTLDALTALADQTRVKPLAKEIAKFTESNPDCNATTMQDEMLCFLRELLAADGILDEREELAFEAVERTFAEANKPTLTKAAEDMTDVAKTAGNAMLGTVTTIGKTATEMTEGLSHKLLGQRGNSTRT